MSCEGVIGVVAHTQFAIAMGFFAQTRQAKQGRHTFMAPCHEQALIAEMFEISIEACNLGLGRLFPGFID